MKTRVICLAKGNVIAVVVDGIYNTHLFQDWDLEKVRRSTKGRKRPEDGWERLRPEREEVRIDVFIDEAERFQVSSEWWGWLPAWCRRCGATHVVSVEELRIAVRSRRREVLVEGQAVR